MKLRSTGSYNSFIQTFELMAKDFVGQKIGSETPLDEKATLKSDFLGRFSNPT